MSEEVTGQETGSEQLSVPEINPQVTPPANQAPEGQAPPQGEVAPEGEQGQPEENKGKERLNARFSELTGKAKAAETAAEDARREAEYWRTLATQGGGHQPQRQEQPQGDGSPDPSQYELGEFDPAYIRDTIQHGIKTGFTTVLAEREAEQARETESRTQAERIGALQQKFFESGLTGAALIASGDNSVPFTAAMADALSVSENAAVVADHLGNNPQEAARIARLPPSQVGYELARIESRLASTKPTTAPGATPTVDGITPAAGGFRSGMSQADFEAEMDRKHGSIYGRKM